MWRVSQLGIRENQGAASSPAGTVQQRNRKSGSKSSRYATSNEPSTTYWYEAPTVGYAAVLELTTEGFIRSDPGLCQLEE